MTQNENLKLDNELKILSQGVYKVNENVIPKDWIKLEEFDNKETGFNGKAFYKNGKIVLAFRGTEFSYMNDTENDSQMYDKHFPSQIIDAML